MPYSAVDIANYFVRTAIERGAPLTPMEVVKLTFLAHGWHLGNFNEPLINESVEAWKFGPVIPRVYFAFQNFGRSPITEPCTYLDFASMFSRSTANVEPPELSEDVKDLLDGVYRQYSKYTAGQLSTLTHQEGSPWDQVTKRFTSKGLEIPRSWVIPNDIIRDYYHQKVQAQSNA